MVVSGPLQNAQLIVHQVDLETAAVLDKSVGQTTTDAEGRFSIETGTANGLLLITARGGSFTDLATGATIELDATNEVRSYAWLDLLEVRDDALVSPVGEMIVARTAFKLATRKDITDAQDDAAEHLNRHFGNADWTRLKLVGLDQPASSPTEGVRAALVQASLSFLAQDIALAAGASPQEVNVFTLTKAWAEDISAGTFDGNDNNDRATGSGLQVGVCPPVDPACVIPDVGCTTGSCRSLCDVYVGMPRALLGGIMTKVIRNPEINKTGLDVNDTLAIARSVSDNIDDDLFGSACIETLDRLAPTVVWTGGPDDGAYVRSAITLQVTVIDDLDPNPRAAIVGFPDADGDPTNASAIANIDTAQLVDGALEVVATGTDIAGNTASITRNLTVDNTPPVLTLASTGFFVDGTTWWTAAATPALGGTVQDTSPTTIKAIVNGVETAGTVTGNTWSISLAAGTIDLGGRDVAIVATDAAGNQRQLLQRLRYDATPPQLSLQNPTVLNEASEVPTYTDTPTVPATTEIPQHLHNGTAINLDAGTTCPVVTKFSYLLSQAPPRYGLEFDGNGNSRRNPILYPVLVGDDGVGIAPNSAQYRVVRRATNTVVRDWASAGVGTSVAPNTLRHDVGIYDGPVAGLATTEGIYDVQLRATDRLNRTTTLSRCFDLKLKAPPLRFTTGGPAAGHAAALNALVLGPPGSGKFNAIATRLLNPTSEGASLLDQRFINGTAETVYLTVDVTPHTSVVSKRTFVRRNVRTNRSTSPIGDCEATPSLCDKPSSVFAYQSAAPGNIETVAATTSYDYPVRVFETTSAGSLMSEIPCIAPCTSADTSFQFAIPPRPFTQTVGNPPRYFVAMTMISARPELGPFNNTTPTTPPFADTTVTNITSSNVTQTVTLTGKLEASSTGCTDVGFTTMGKMICKERSTVRVYRALRDVELQFSNVLKSDASTAPTPSIPPRLNASLSRDGHSWTATVPDTSLPNYIVP